MDSKPELDKEAKVDEETPMMRPARLELAPHARLGLNVSMAFALSILSLIHVAVLIVGALNVDAVCERPLAVLLVLYGLGGLFFVALCVRQWCTISDLGAWPDRRMAVLIMVNLTFLFALGCTLVQYTSDTSDTCRLTAPILYRWSFAITLFFLILCSLVAVVPLLRILARCLIAPLALCLVACVDTLRADVEVDMPAIEIPEMGKFRMPRVPNAP